MELYDTDTNKESTGIATSVKARENRYKAFMGFFPHVSCGIGWKDSFRNFGHKKLFITPRIGGCLKKDDKGSYESFGRIPPLKEKR